VKLHKPARRAIYPALEGQSENEPPTLRLPWDRKSGVFKRVNAVRCWIDGQIQRFSEPPYTVTL
jgi:hypothetical protein